jgi:glutamate synthase domain-containing protein 3
MRKEDTAMELRAGEIYYNDLNNRIKEIAQEPGEIVVREVYGQRYMGCGLKSHTKLTVHGTLGNDSACYMDGATLEVFGNAQDGIANTMNDGKLIVHGNCGDIMGYAMRGGEVYIQGYAGYRAGIHMKEYMDKVPLIVIGSKGGDFLGEYMASGRIVVLGLGLGENEPSVGRFFGTGMHGGKMFVRGKVNEALMGREISQAPLDAEDEAFLKKVIAEYAAHFGADVSGVKLSDFKKYQPRSKRPYGNMYIGN